MNASGVQALLGLKMAGCSAGNGCVQAEEGRGTSKRIRPGDIGGKNNATEYSDLLKCPACSLTELGIRADGVPTFTE
ncbi:hypothetical protein JZ751_013857, partial [Albula glossodonta]